MTLSRNVWKYLTRLHKWAGLVLGLQILIWFCSGFFFTLFPIEQVRGTHLRAETAGDVVLAGVNFASVAASHDQPFETLEVRQIAERIVVTIDDTHHYGPEGLPLPALERDAIATTAKLNYAGNGVVSALTLLDEAPLDYRGPLPIWQAKFDDRSKTRFYLDPITGDIRSVRTRVWRIFDTMWMLHIMDYSERTRFSTWWLRLFSGASILFALSGLALVAHRVFLRPRRERTV